MDRRDAVFQLQKTISDLESKVAELIAENTQLKEKIQSYSIALDKAAECFKELLG